MFQMWNKAFHPPVKQICIKSVSITLNVLFYKYETVPALKEFTVSRKDIIYHMQLCSKPVIFEERSWGEVTRKAPYSTCC